MNDYQKNEFYEKLKRIVYNLVKNMNDEEQFDFLYDYDFKNNEVEELGLKELLGQFIFGKLRS